MNKKIDREILLALVKKTHQKSKASMKHAWTQIDKARLLINHDNEMAVFRAITAEEEAATAIITSLKRLKYLNSDKLSEKKHAHKAGLYAIVTIINNFFRELQNTAFEDVIVTLNNDKKLVINLVQDKLSNKVLQPTPPLGFSLSDANKAEVLFEDQAHKLVTSNNKKNFKDMINKEANLRNEVLYASPAGAPTINDSPVDFINQRMDRVINLTYIYLLIEQNPEKQLFVQQAINAYVELLNN